MEIQTVAVAVLPNPQSYYAAAKSRQSRPLRAPGLEAFRADERRWRRLDAANQLAALLDRDNLASWVWARVEHVFAAQKRRLHLVIPTIGLARATTKITLANLAYNMRRLMWIEGRTLPA